MVEFDVSRKAWNISVKRYVEYRGHRYTQGVDELSTARVRILYEDGG